MAIVFSFLDSFTEEAQDRLKRSLLECSLLFHSNNPLVAGIDKSDILSKSIFAIIADIEGTATVEKISDVYLERFGKSIDDDMLDRVLKSLLKSNFISPFEDGYRPHKHAAETMHEGVQQFEERMKLLNQQLLAKAKGKIEGTLDEPTKQIIERNIRKSLNLYFQLYALDYVFDDDAEHKVEEEDVINEVKRDLSEGVCDALLEAFSELIEHPTDEQKETLMLCVKLFVGAQFLQIDPLVSQMELAKLKEKRFIIDTDFLLYSITRHCRQSAEYKKLLKTLRKVGCELIIPNEVVTEVLNHAQCAESNYYRFHNTLEAVDAEAINEKANNVFVKDYCMNRLHNHYTKSIRAYLYDNYLSQDEPLEFIKDFIRDELHIEPGLEVDMPIDNEYLYVKDQLIEKIYEKTRKSDKDRWRDDNETRAIAETDSKLLLNALALNKNIQSGSKKEILNANTYLVTFTTKGIKSAKELNIYRKVVTRPEILINLLMEIGMFDDKHNGMFNLFDNPFLAQIMSEHWDVLTALSKTGVDLHGHSVTKLGRDLAATVHTYLTKNSDAEHVASADNYNFEAISTVDEFLRYVTEIKRKNYKFMPDAEKLIEKYKEQKAEKEKAEANAAKTKALLEKKARGYDAYLRKTGRRPGESKPKKRIMNTGRKK